MMKNNILILFILAFIALSCNQQPEQKTVQQQPAKPRADVPVFNEDSALAYVAKQIAFGPRVPNTKAHAQCADWLTATLRRFGHDVIVQKGQVYAYNNTLLNFKNIIGVWNPDAAKRILLCAHWDSRPFADHDPDPAKRHQPVEGANDGASGVGVLLEVARQLQAKTPEVGVDIVLFDVEDYGPHQETPVENSNEQWGLGSQYWSKNPHKEGYSALYGILLDMVGASNAVFLQEGISMEYAGDIVKHVWTTANRIGYSGFFRFENGGYITDDHLFVNKYRNIPTIDIIHQDRSTESGFYPYWHTTGDTFDKIDKFTLKAVGQTVLTVVFEQE
jgi:Zn-dependent M28 family amino/carboxypeptidase